MTRGRPLIAAMVFLFLLVLGDCWSTYLCLNISSTEYRVWEYNPLSNWVFETFGMVEGLVLFTIAKGLGLIYLHRLSKQSILHHKTVCVMVVIAILITGYANINNWNVYMVLKGTI